jgi:hypothetical protein
MAKYEVNANARNNVNGKEENKAASKTVVINRAGGGLLLTLLAGIVWIYGFAGEVRYAGTTGYPTTGLDGQSATTKPQTQTQTTLGDLYIIDSIFVVIGFGLLFSYFKKSTFSAVFITLFTASLTILISPIFSKFWYNVFITNFSGYEVQTKDATRFYQSSLGGLYIYLDYYNLRIALANAIAQLVVILALFGKLNAVQIIINSFLFNFIWNLNHFLCVLLATKSPDSRFFDDYQISNVYLFAACYGLVVSFILRSPETSLTPLYSSSRNSTILGQLGTFFLFLSFCTTTTMFTIKYTLSSTEMQRSYVWQVAFLSIFLAMSASIIFNYAFSVLFNSNSKLGIRGSLVGTITGAIMYGSIAGTCVNIGAAIASGLFSGFLSALFFEVIYPKLNSSRIRDSFGLFGILAISFLGTFFIAPIVLKTYYNYDVDLSTLYNQNAPTTAFTVSNVDSIGWVLVYVGISMGIGLVGGVIMGLFLSVFNRIISHHFDDSEFFRVSVYGLRSSPVAA